MCRPPTPRPIGLCACVVATLSPSPIYVRHGRTASLHAVFRCLRPLSRPLSRRSRRGIGRRDVMKGNAPWLRPALRLTQVPVRVARCICTMVACSTLCIGRTSHLSCGALSWRSRWRVPRPTPSLTCPRPVSPVRTMLLWTRSAKPIRLPLRPWRLRYDWLRPSTLRLSGLPLLTVSCVTRLRRLCSLRGAL